MQNIESFRNFLLAQNRSKDTVNTYAMIARVFEAAGNISRDGALALIASKTHTDTKRLYFYALKAYAQWKQLDLLAGIKASKNKRRTHVPSISKEEIDQLLYSKTSSHKNSQDLCAKALFNLLTSSGMRLSEALGLDIQDLGPLVIIRGKGDKEREVYISQRALETVREYIKDRVSGPIFINSKGKPFTRIPCWLLLQRWSKKILGRQINPHLLRHTFATQMLERGANLKTIQELLGHYSIATTQIYLNPSKNHILNEFLSCNPIG